MYISSWIILRQSFTMLLWKVIIPKLRKRNIIISAPREPTQINLKSVKATRIATMERQWRFIKNLVKLVKLMTVLVSVLKVGELEITKPAEICEDVNQFFGSVGENLANTLLPPESNECFWNRTWWNCFYYFKTPNKKV